ncbi:MAG: imidazoleglycerol-phosphate dehydratase HisB, partial [Candidatus Hydrothermarchaeales archaeon]
RKTKETDIVVEINIDGSGKYNIDTGVKFFDHLLSSFSRHGSIDLKVSAKGDNEHHIVEDIAICLGEAFTKSLGEKRGIARFGHAIIPMDDVLMLASIDLGGRSYCSLDLKMRKKKVEDLSVEMLPHFLETFASEARLNLHMKLLDGRNDHHKAECLFKALGIAIRGASREIGGGIPSTKGRL